MRRGRRKSSPHPRNSWAPSRRVSWPEEGEEKGGRRGIGKREEGRGKRSREGEGRRKSSPQPRNSWAPSSRASWPEG
jgi:hypothetical protein